MSSVSSRDSLQALPDWSAVPSDSEEDRRLVGQRIAYFAAVLGLVSAAFLVFNLGIGVAINPEWQEQAVHPSTLAHAAAALELGVIWLLCRGGQRRSSQLNLLDVWGVLLTSTFYALMILLAPESNFTQTLILTLIVVSTLNLHAIIVPATARRTAWLSTLASLPVLLTAWLISVRNPHERLGGEMWAGFAAVGFVGMWCLTGILTSALASRIIYGLQQRVRAATELGQYTLEEKIGEGGMGAVYRARHALLRRPTAIKLISRDRADERQIHRFEREVQLTSSLTHPNTIAIYDFGRTPDGIFYYAMEHLDGITLEELVTHAGPQPPARVVHILKQVCGALVEAHHVGLVHRDIKPANIMLTLRGCVPDHVKVLDFGLVKEVAAGDTGTTGQGTLLGTPLYLAPETITNPDAVSAATDLYALGAVAYFLLSARPVFEGQTVVEVCSKHLLAEPVPPSRASGIDLPAQLEQLVMQCLAKAPEQRPSSAATLRDALSSLVLKDEWSPEQARRWWAEPARALQATITAERKQRRSTTPATIAIDFTDRSAVAGPVRG